MTDVELLKMVVERMQKQREYDELYIAYLAKLIDEEEFNEQSQEFAYSPKLDFDIEEIKNQVRRLLQLTTTKYTTSNLVDIFQVPYEILDDIREEFYKKT
jgi:protein associated with RNAse G/E